MKLNKILTSIGAAVCTCLLGIELSIIPAAAQSSRPYIVLVNGWGNCCAWGIADRFPPMNADIRYVPYSNFNNMGRSSDTSTDEQFLRDGADYINNQLDRNRPLILIGHSFGGDSVLKLLRRINRRIQFVAVIDPVSTGGFRAPLTRSLAVGNNVDYFFNRWQENVMFPNDFKTNGTIPCSASRCDQEAQNLARSEDGSTRTIDCRWDEVTCPGFVAPNPFIGRKGRKGKKQVRTNHQDLAKDAYIQKTLGDRITQVLASFRPPASTPTGIPVPVNFGNTLFYDRNSGVCEFRRTDGSVVQRLASCRRTWHSIVYTDNKLLFYDRDAGDIETYEVGNQGLGKRLHSYGAGSMRKTWAQVTSPQVGIIVFRDDNGEVETYRLNNIGRLQGL